MSATLEKILLGTADLSLGNRLRSLARERGIEVVLFHNQQTCTTGCRTTVEVWAHPDDVGEILRIQEEERRRVMGGLDFDPALLDAVFDPTQPTAKCPACAASFATELGECPDCGLVFG